MLVIAHADALQFQKHRGWALFSDLSGTFAGLKQLFTALLFSSERELQLLVSDAIGERIHQKSQESAEGGRQSVETKG